MMKKKEEKKSEEGNKEEGIGEVKIQWGEGWKKNRKRIRGLRKRGVWGKGQEKNNKKVKEEKKEGEVKVLRGEGVNEILDGCEN